MAGSWLTFILAGIGLYFLYRTTIADPGFLPRGNGARLPAGARSPPGKPLLLVLLLGVTTHRGQKQNAVLLPTWVQRSCCRPGCILAVLPGSLKSGWI
jgi:hypothetical protein